MKKQLLVPAIILLACICSTSCVKHNHPPQTVKSLLIGKWKGIMIAADMNQNGKQDGTERFSFSAPASYDSLTFNGDGTGYQHMHVAASGTIFDTPFDFNWILSSDEGYITGLIPGSLATKVYIDELTTTFVRFKYTDSVTYWREYSKL
jgi:hypothetical protein